MTPIRKIVTAAAFGLTALFAKESLAGSKHTPIPGSIVAIGGGEDKADDMVVLKAFLAETKKQNPNIVVVTTASEEPEKRKKEYTRAFKKLGADRITVIFTDTRFDAFDPNICKQLKGADAIFFSGGDQLRLTALFGGTPFLDEVRQMNKNGAVVGGTSAGGAVLSDLMVYEGRPAQAAEKGEILLTSGFRFIDRVAFDTHFMERNRLYRLFNITASNPEILGIGLDEDTGVIFRNGGNVFEVVGDGHVTVVDGLRTQSDYHMVQRGERAAFPKMIVHTLSAGDRFNIKERAQILSLKTALKALHP